MIAGILYEDDDYDGSGWMTCHLCEHVQNEQRRVWFLHKYAFSFPVSQSQKLLLLSFINTILEMSRENRTLRIFDT